MLKNPPANAGDVRDLDSFPGSGRSPGGAQDNQFQYSYLENSKDRGAWWSTVLWGHKESDITEDKRTKQE